MKRKKTVWITLLVLALSAALLIGCTPVKPADAQVQTDTPVLHTLTGGVLNLKINPEIALHYDETGKVTKLEGRNADGRELIRGYTGYTGKDTTEVLTALVERIGQAGYFVEEADGKARQIVLELDPGSQTPHDTFLEDMAAHVKKCVEEQNWIGEREYAYTDTPSKETTPAETVFAPTEPLPVAGKTHTPCDICGEYDCDDGAYCDDADEKAENLREQENRRNGTPCGVCGDYDCDDGAYCDDWDARFDDDDDDDCNGDHHRGKHHDCDD